ncbi:MAG: hypothetical protein K9M10_03660 [Candidatus Pacebacteria bacterium]|nr:hypothetical protein [Candidatus Paceibacterota bacterium]MCF7857548.1 hypothetical protein [Candidatus Paceibacterota bacterium]
MSSNSVESEQQTYTKEILFAIPQDEYVVISFDQNNKKVEREIFTEKVRNAVIRAAKDTVIIQKDENPVSIQEESVSTTSVFDKSEEVTAVSSTTIQADE